MHALYLSRQRFSWSQFSLLLFLRWFIHLYLHSSKLHSFIPILSSQKHMYLSTVINHFRTFPKHVRILYNYTYPFTYTFHTYTYSWTHAYSFTHTSFTYAKQVFVHTYPFTYLFTLHTSIRIYFFLCSPILHSIFWP